MKEAKRYIQLLYPRAGRERKEWNHSDKRVPSSLNVYPSYELRRFYFWVLLSQILKDTLNRFVRYFVTKYFKHYQQIIKK